MNFKKSSVFVWEIMIGTNKNLKFSNIITVIYYTYTLYNNIYYSSINIWFEKKSNPRLSVDYMVP